MNTIILLQSEILEVPDTLSLVKSLQDQVQNLTWANTLSRSSGVFTVALSASSVQSGYALFLYAQKAKNGCPEGTSETSDAGSSLSECPTF